MTPTGTALEADWLGRAAAPSTGLERVLADVADDRRAGGETGTRGSGGDRTLVLDAAAEDVMFAELEGLTPKGYRFLARVGGARRGGLRRRCVRVIIDPIDGSLNAKRGDSHYALSVAVADGPTMADVAFGFVHDFGASEQWWAYRGQGAWLDGEAGSTRRCRSGVTVTAGSSWWRSSPRTRAGSPSRSTARRGRAPAPGAGAIAVDAVQVAAARFDGMVTLLRSRGVDAAAGQLIVREAGGVVSFPDCDDPLGAPLDAAPELALVAARDAGDASPSSRGTPA